MKDELGGEIMTEFATLGPKMYALKTGSLSGPGSLRESKSKKCKGIKSALSERR